MASPDRAVRHLRLRAFSQAQVQAAAWRLEDALRCASLPDQAGRLLLVRHLDLGRFDQEASPQSLALAIERGVAQAGLAWVHGAAPAAPDARAVWFHDLLEACVTLSRRLAEGRPTDAWFWPLAIPGFQWQEGPDAGLRRIVLKLAEDVAAPRALPLWAASLAQAGHAQRLAAALGPAEAAILTRAAGLAPLALAAVTPAPPDQTSSTHPLAGPVPGSGSSLPPDLPPWLNALLLASGSYGPVRGAGQGALSFVTGTEIATTRPEPVPPRVSWEHSIPPGAREVVPRPAGQPAPPRRGRYDSSPSLGDPSQAAPHDEEDPTPVPVVPISVAETEASPATWPATLATARGGLLFVLPVLARLGYGTWWEDLPAWRDAQVVPRLLINLLERLRTPPADPAWQLCAGLLAPEATTPDPLSFPIPPAWRDPALAMPLPEAGTPLNPGQAADLWLRATRRWLRRRAGLGLASLVNRPAGLIWNATHLDVVFDLNQAEPRIRRAGLDLDPGWLPWLGRVVSFHYQQDGLA